MATQTCDLLDRIGEYLTGVGCEPRRDPSHDCVWLEYAGHHGAYAARVWVEENPLRVQLLIHLDRVVPPDRRRIMLDAINRANLVLEVGCFEMDPEEGALLLRSTHLVADGELTRDQFLYAFAEPCMAADEFRPAFCRLLHSPEPERAETRL
jgi:hypothetical protein